MLYQKSKDNGCPLYRHDCYYHEGVPQRYITEIIASESKIVKLNCLEGVLIEKQSGPLSMNERNEQGRGGLVRISATRVS